MTPNNSSDKMAKIVSLCKRRGFVFQSSEIYGGLKSSYDYGHLGVELKRNIASQWWSHMVHGRDNIYGLDAAIMMHSDVWKASGHLANFSDPLVDCLNCGARFRADKAPKKEPGSTIEYGRFDAQRKKAKPAQAQVAPCGYICPQCGSPFLSSERQFNGMFRSTLGPIDPIRDFFDRHDVSQMSKDELLEKINGALSSSAIYLRPETAQAMFVQFLNLCQTTSAKIPMGVAQIGKSFRNEIIVEHFIFRSCEFEQMEMEFFCEPGTQRKWLDYWKDARLKWHQKYSNYPEHYRLRQHDPDELAHYSDCCYDVEYLYPWGWDEIEGVASRTDYDLKKHRDASGAKLTYFDPQKEDPQTGKKGWRYVPYVVEPAAGLTRIFLSVLLDAYHEEVLVDDKGQEKTRVVLKIHPTLAPLKAAILPLLRKDGQPEKAADIAKQFRKRGIHVSYDEVSSIGKRYAKHDEIGTPYCLTVDGQSLVDDSITVRYRDTTKQERIPISEIFERLTFNESLV